jgi:SAM-dependent methyltransferase
MQSAEQVARIRSIFGGTASVYDEIVDAATRGEDRYWKERMLEKLGQPRRVLDLACGTGILVFMIRDRLPATRVVGLDISEEYLERARARAHGRRDDMPDQVTCPDEIQNCCSAWVATGCPGHAIRIRRRPDQPEYRGRSGFLHA